MARCKRIVGERRRVCIGDMNQKIKIQTRDLASPSADNVDYGESFTDAKTIWAMVQTTRGGEFFDGTELNNPYTHFFYIRFIPNSVFSKSGRLTSQEWIRWKNRTFKIVDVENLEERNEILLLRCRERGDEAKPVNFA